MHLDFVNTNGPPTSSGSQLTLYTDKWGWRKQHNEGDPSDKPGKSDGQIQFINQIKAYINEINLSVYDVSDVPVIRIPLCAKYWVDTDYTKTFYESDGVTVQCSKTFGSANLKYKSYIIDLIKYCQTWGEGETVVILDLHWVLDTPDAPGNPQTQMPTKDAPDASASSTYVELMFNELNLLLRNFHDFVTPSGDIWGSATGSSSSSDRQPIIAFGEILTAGDLTVWQIGDHTLSFQPTDGNLVDRVYDGESGQVVHSLGPAPGDLISYVKKMKLIWDSDTSTATLKLESGGNTYKKIEVPLAEKPDGLWFDASGNLFFGNLNGNQIKPFNVTLDAMGIDRDRIFVELFNEPFANNNGTPDFDIYKEGNSEVYGMETLANLLTVNSTYDDDTTGDTLLEKWNGMIIVSGPDQYAWVVDDNKSTWITWMTSGIGSGISKNRIIANLHPYMGYYQKDNPTKNSVKFESFVQALQNEEIAVICTELGQYDGPDMVWDDSSSYVDPVNNFLYIVEGTGDSSDSRSCHSILNTDGDPTLTDPTCVALGCSDGSCFETPCTTSDCYNWYWHNGLCNGTNNPCSYVKAILDVCKRKNVSFSAWAARPNRNLYHSSEGAMQPDVLTGKIVGGGCDGGGGQGKFCPLLTNPTSSVNTNHSACYDDSNPLGCNAIEPNGGGANWEMLWFDAVVRTQTSPY